MNIYAIDGAAMSKEIRMYSVFREKKREREIIKRETLTQRTKRMLG